MKNVFTLLFVLSLGQLSWAQSVTTLVNDPARDFEAIHWHEDGRIYAVDYFNGRLYQVYTDGSVETIATGFSNLAGGGFHQDGTFYFSDLTTGVLHRLNADGTTSPVVSGLNQPTGILNGTDPDLLYVAQYGNNSVARVSIGTGTVSTWVSANGINGPDGIIFAADGSLLVANYNNNRVTRVTLAGEVSSFATLPATGIMGYLARVGSDVYVPSIAGKRIYRLDEAGNATLVAGTGGTGHTDGDAQTATFTTPNGICASPSGDTLLITDRGRIRMITQLNPVRSHDRSLELPAFTLGPNPAADALTVTFRLSTPRTLAWRILTPGGQIIKTAAPTPLPTGLHTHAIDLNGLPAGSYLLQWQDERQRSFTHPFVKS